jgi:hypothetical protein
MSARPCGSAGVRCAASESALRDRQDDADKLGEGRKIGVTAQSHKVIHNLLAEVERAAAEENLDFKGIKRGDHWESANIKTSGSIAALLDPEVSRSACLHRRARPHYRATALSPGRARFRCVWLRPYGRV